MENSMFQLVAIKTQQFVTQNLLKVHKALQRVNIECHGYEQIIKHIKKGDFIYIDPPYIPLDPPPLQSILRMTLA